jgi:hypothetical protein
MSSHGRAERPGLALDEEYARIADDRNRTGAGGRNRLIDPTPDFDGNLAFGGPLILNPRKALHGSDEVDGKSAAAADATTSFPSSALGISRDACRSINPVSIAPAAKSGSAAARDRNPALVCTGQIST